MKKYDVIVIGSGCGMSIVDEALRPGLSVALVDKGPLGGTCANTGCIPSKMLIFAADRVTEMEEANVEASLAAYNGLHDNTRVRMDYSSAPHAVYSHPQIASVGLTEEAARKKHKVLVGKAHYSDVAQGEAMMEKNGFAKAIVEAEGKRILGFHLIGPYAPILIQEVIDAMTSGGGIDVIQRSMQIHPAITELIPAALSGLENAV